MRAIALVCLFLASAVPASAQNPPPNSRPAAPTAKVAAIPAPRDVPFPGTMQLTVDASDVTRGIFRIRQRVPVSGPGDLVLLYPQWLPGNHAPSGDIKKIAGLRFSAGGRTLEWVRDPLDVFAFHVDVPAGVSAVDAEFHYLSATTGNQGRIVATPEMASIQWIANSLYAAGHYVRQIPVQASVITPAGWTVAGALRPSGPGAGNRVTFETVSYETLVDSPLIAGLHYRQIPLTDRVFLDVIADTPAELAAKPEQIAAHRRLVDQSLKLFGARHYDHYNFLLTISNNLGGIGLEHHRSSENGVKRGYFTDWENAGSSRVLLPHEFVHSWNGKYRRGADLWAPDYRTQTEPSLLWLYEGQTQFWGYVLAARSGMLSKEDTLGALASTAATYAQATPGRAWRPLVDTTNDPTIARRAPQAWRGWQRSEDYYSEGLMIWTDVDRIIRQQSGGRRSMDDFARAFFGMNDGDWGVLTYRFDVVVATLNRVQPYDWAGYLNRRVNSVAPEAPLEGFTQGGYDLVFTEEPTEWIKVAEKRAKNHDFTYSGGFVVGNDRTISSVIWDGPAFNSGMTVGSELLAVNGRTFDADALKAAIKAAKGTSQPVRLLIKSGDVYRTLDLNWSGGLRYPRLVKRGRAPGTLDALLAPRR